MRIIFATSVVVGASLAALLTNVQQAEACGCLSPPAAEAGDFAVNQQSEQIIFEVEDGVVTAHVLIKFAGKPSEFAWIVPAPSVPELGLSPASAFGLLETQTQASVSIQQDDLCPEQQYFCRSHPAPSCGLGDSFPGDGDGDGDGDSFSDAGSAGEPAPPIEVLSEQTIGDYQTVTFAAGDAAAAVTWLNSEGFIVNETMAPFMQPYADAGMVFVASKLVPGADVSSIKPLRLRYLASQPMIPLKLTAVAAEPHMTVTTYIYGATAYQPDGHPLIAFPEPDLAFSPSGRSNYPMVLAKAVDAAGGDGFLAEYVGAPVTVDFGQGTGCCDSEEFDQCGIEFDGICSCPGNAFDEDDCGEDGAALAEGAEFLEAMAAKHASLTRLTTRLSAEEMTFDPIFVPLTGSEPFRLQLSNTTNSLASCESSVVDKVAYDRITETSECAATYCGSGECVLTDSGVGCRCPLGEVARKFVDLDGQASVTCAPAVAPVDLEAGGIELPDVCAQTDCGVGGTCIAVGGFPSCECAPGMAAASGTAPAAPVCRPIEGLSGSVGAEDFSTPLAKLDVCAPAVPATCGADGWLVKVPVEREGIDCSGVAIDPNRFVVPDAPHCERGFDPFGCGCDSTRDRVSGITGLLGLGLLFAFSFFGWALVWRRKSP